MCKKMYIKIKLFFRLIMKRESDFYFILTPASFRGRKCTKIFHFTAKNHATRRTRRGVYGSEVPTASPGHHVTSFHSNKKAGLVLSWLAPPEVFLYRLLLLRFPERIVHFCIATVDHFAAYPQLLFSKKR